MLGRYARWLHLRWPAGTVETLPEVNEDGTTSVPGLLVVGDLTGVPLLKLALDSGARAVERLDAELGPAGGDPELVDVAIVGGGVAGIAAALEAKRRGRSFVVLEAAQPFSTLVNFPKAKPIFTYPTDLRPAGELQVTADVKEALVEELERQRRAAGIEPVRAKVDRIERAPGELRVVRDGDAKPLRARRVIVAIGRSGNYRRLGVPGEELDKVTNRLHDPKAYAGQRALVVGGGDSAVETAVALADAGATVTLSYRKPALARPKPGNVERLEALATRGALTLRLGTEVSRIGPTDVALKDGAREEVLANDVVFTMIGREAPLDFFRRSGVPIRGEWTAARVATFTLFVAFCVWLYLWKSSGSPLYPGEDDFPHTVPRWLLGLGGGVAALVKDRTTLLGTIAWSARSPSFYYTLTYTTLVIVFGVRRLRRRRTPYVTAQTITLILVQTFPLFLLPEVILPNLGYRGVFAHGAGQAIADQLFPLYPGQSDAVWPDWGHPRAYWQAYGLILAWPLFIYNVFAAKPSATWLAISGVQTFVLIPLIVWRWGKGAYCGWLCSCGALAETLGDAHRTKMPHGPGWNRLNLLGQGLLAVCFALLGLRIAGWVWPGGWASRVFPTLLEGTPLSYKWVVDVGLAGIVGVGCYFWLSGRVWCRFACPLAALMHLYARFTRFRIFAEKKRCISCNVCTSVCHQGIDVMSFAQRGAPMEDPECVRCSACVSSCPTGTLSFGRVGGDGAPVLDRLLASPVQGRERTGRPLPVVAHRGRRSA